MKVVGYSDRFSVAAGENIRFMVSCEPSDYQADIVRLIHGDPNPAGPGFKEKLVPTHVNGKYRGREQSLSYGSYVTVPDSPRLREVGSFTLQAWIYPTTPEKGVQGLLTKWSTDDEGGYGLFVGEDGSVALWIGDRSGVVERVGTGKSLVARQWYFVAGAYDSQAGRVWVYQEPLTIWPEGSRAVVERATPVSAAPASDSPFLMAGYPRRDESGETFVGGNFNGKIDGPRLFGRALETEEVESLRRDAPAASFGQDLIAAWDFARDIATSKVTDSSPNRLDGRAVNMPARAMTGHNWDTNEFDFKTAPDQYGAIYFHDDDLDDAGWEADFELTVPKQLKSGVYAARLLAGDDEDYVPFFVRPRRGESSAPILFLAPTATYMAYANNHSLGRLNGVVTPRLAARGIEFKYPSQAQDKWLAEQKLSSLYDIHTDGSGVCYSSRMRPIVTMRPKYNLQHLALGEGAPHLIDADLHLLDWMEAKEFRYDVVTDEDLHYEGRDLLAPYRVVVTGSHPEYWSSQMLDGLHEYMAGGGRLMYMGGNGFYWVTSFDPERPHVIEVRRWHGTEAWEAGPGEYYHSTTGELGGLWRFRGRPPQALLGVGFTAEGADFSVPYRRQPDSNDPRVAFIFEGVDESEAIGDFGLVMGGAGGFEVDRADASLGTPDHALVVATTTGLSDDYQHVVEEVANSNPREGGTTNPLVRGDMVYFEGPKDGAVFSVSSISWCGSLSHHNYDNDVSRITENVLRKFSADGAVS